MGRFCVSVVAALALFTASGAASQPIATMSPAGMEALWVFGGEAASDQHFDLEIITAGTFPVGEALGIEAQVSSDSVFHNVHLQFHVFGPDGAAVLSGEQLVDLAQGINNAIFRTDFSALPPGTYKLRCTMLYSDEADPLVATRWVKRVSAAQFGAELGELDRRLSNVSDKLTSSPAGGYPYLRVRANISRIALTEAQSAASAQAWSEVDQYVDYLLRAVDKIEAGLAFGGAIPEINQPIPERRLDVLDQNAGGFTSDGHPVYLVGTRVPLHDGGKLPLLRSLGLNLAVTQVSPADVISAGDIAVIPEHLTSMLSSASATNVAVAVSLDPSTLPANVTTMPIEYEGQLFVNAAGFEVQSTLDAHLRSVLPVLNQHPIVLGVSLLDDPHFKFDSPEVHRAYIDLVKGMYTDRQTLNQTWHAHLASYEDITIWGHFIDARPAPTIEKHHYPNRRAYQYDFQHFHRELVRQYVDRLMQAAQELAPNVPATVVATDQVFAVNETLHGFDREDVGAVVDFLGVSSSTDPIDPAYALSYPKRVAFYSFMWSLQPEKPLLDFGCDLNLDSSLSAQDTFRYVYTALWEAFMNGADAVAISNAEAMESPDSLEALATAAMDVNRLGHVITAFQDAPAEVGVLISESSKIFDGGIPHLESSMFAFEGCTFSGYKVRFITEEEIQQGKLSDLRLLVIPHTPSVEEATFVKLDEYVQGGGAVARVGTPIPYDPRGVSRTDVLRNTANTVLVRGINLPTEYLHAMDASIEMGTLPLIPRAINEHGYPLEGVKTRFVQGPGGSYLYIANLRKEAQVAFLTGGMQSGRDLLTGRMVRFPLTVKPLEPLLILLDPTVNETVVTPVVAKKR